MKNSPIILFLFVLIVQFPIQAQQPIKLESFNKIPLYDSLSIYEIGEIGVLNEREIIVGDRLLYKVYKINNLDNVIAETGRRGQGPGEFIVAPYKITVDKEGNNIAVLDHTTPQINIYDDKLNFKTRITNKLPPSDIIYAGKDMLILGVPPTPQSYNSVFIYKENKFFSSFDLDVDFINIAYDNYVLDYLEKEKLIVVVYQNRNLIQFYSLDGSFRSEVILDGLPIKSEESEMEGRAMALPAHHIFSSVSVSNGKIYILGSHYSEFPNQTVYVLASDGSLINKLVVEEPVRTIEVENEILFTGNRNVMKTYKLNYEDIDE